MSRDVMGRSGVRRCGVCSGWEAGAAFTTIVRILGFLFVLVLSFAGNDEDEE